MSSLQALIETPLTPHEYPRTRWLPPLEFTECLEDSPSFRENVNIHERDLKETSKQIEGLEKSFTESIKAAKNFCKTQKSLATNLANFNYEFIGLKQTDAERFLVKSLKEFGNFIAEVEDERERMFSKCYETIIQPLRDFREKQVGEVLKYKKLFDRESEEFYFKQANNLGLSNTKKTEALQGNDMELQEQKKKFITTSLQYICDIQEVQERKKFEFPGPIQTFMSTLFTCHHFCHDKASDLKLFMKNLQTNIQNIRGSFLGSDHELSSGTHETNIRILMRTISIQYEGRIRPRKHNSVQELIRSTSKNLPLFDPGKEVTKPSSAAIGTFDKRFTRTGHLFLIKKKGHISATRYYCQYVKDSREFSMIPFYQNPANEIMMEKFPIHYCEILTEKDIDRRFCFDIKVLDNVYTLQAPTEQDFNLWIDALNGQHEPVLVHNSTRRSSTALNTILDGTSFDFLIKCLKAVEERGMETEGLYRVGGVASKVSNLMTLGLDRVTQNGLDLDNQEQWSTKTITSAVKRCFHNMDEPLLLLSNYSAFIEAAKLDNVEERYSAICKLVHQLPAPNRRFLEVLLEHLSKVSSKSGQNKMDSVNLGIVVSPSVLRPEEETVAGIIEAKFGNVVLEVMINNVGNIFQTYSSIPVL